MKDWYARGHNIATRIGVVGCEHLFAMNALRLDGPWGSHLPIHFRLGVFSHFAVPVSVDEETGGEHFLRLNSRIVCICG